MCQSMRLCSVLAPFFKLNLETVSVDEPQRRALLAVLLACGVRRHEAVELDFGRIQQREEHWAIVDLKGKAGHTRTIPMPA